MKYPIFRRKKNKHYQYINSNGKQVTNKTEIERINKLRIPPGYHDVKIYPPHAKIQATGIDDKGRIQYRYHPTWIQKRNLKKFHGLIQLSTIYHKLINHFKNILTTKPTTKKQLIALAILVMNICHFRSGNLRHLQETNSYGTTTLQRKHLTIKGQYLHISFMGKSKQLNYCALPLSLSITKALLYLYRKTKSPNDFIFVINKERLSSSTINNYLRYYTNKNITTKDFRTYQANILFIQYALKYKHILLGLSSQKTKFKQAVQEIIKEIALKLHHKPSTYKNAYLFPPLHQLLLEKPQQFYKQFKNSNKLASFIRKTI